MCGIVGYIGTDDAAGVLLHGLRELEYRGYDSAGVAVLETGGIRGFKAVGKLDALAAKLSDYRSTGSVAGIGHTRWATHGRPTEANAHPHGLTHSRVVHNGIIENHAVLRAEVDTPFRSQTDSEVIVHVFERSFARHGQQAAGALQAFRDTLDALEGAYAILLISEHVPGQIFFARRGSPLQVGFGPSGCHLASSDAAMVGVCERAMYLEDGEWGVATDATLKLFDADGAEVVPVYHPVPTSGVAARKEGYRFFMEKEIYEQSEVLASILTGRLEADRVVLEECPLDWLLGFRAVTFCACGTSYHAALAGQYLLEQLAQVPAKVEIASEFRYREPVLEPGELFVVISQSGETADTLEVLKQVKAQGLATLALCNVDNSSIAREAERTVQLRAGMEKGVASTKAFSAQVMTLWLLAVYWGQGRGRFDSGTAPSRDGLSSKSWGRSVAAEVVAMRESVEVIAVPPALHLRVHRLSKRYLHGHGFFYIGRDLFFPLALEGALKLKEISYLHAEGYPAGEMKHGPIALADAHLFTVALMARTRLYEKMKSNVEELSARDATLIAVTAEPFELADDLIRIRRFEHPMLEFFEMLVVLQLLALEIAIRLGHDVDMPRNLAKSVTVE